MYDRVKMWNKSIYNKPPNYILSNLSNIEEIFNKQTAEILGYKGWLKNMRVSVFNSGISIVGSLAKYIYDDNTYSLNKETTKEAIRKLSNSLSFNVDEASITELEFGTNFLVREPVYKYLPLLSEAPYLERLKLSLSSLYYHSKGKTRGKEGKYNKVIQFYDKNIEVKNRGGKIPDIYKGQNVLRYEIRFNSRLPAQLKENTVKAQTLYDRKFYNKMLKIYANRYYSIHKSKQIDMDTSNIKTVSDAFNLYTAKLLNEEKEGQISDYIASLKESNAFNDTKYYTRLKRKFKDVTSLKYQAKNNDLIKELDNEINNLIVYT